jgi:hypothetical protein
LNTEPELGDGHGGQTEDGGQANEGLHVGAGTSVVRWLIFKPKFGNLGKFWRAFDCKLLTYFMAI